MRNLLEQELETYAVNIDSLLASSEGKFVLVHCDKLLGTFDSQVDAITWGYRELGNVPFLVKQVLKVEVPLNFVSNLIGV